VARFRNSLGLLAAQNSNVSNPFSGLRTIENTQIPGTHMQSNPQMLPLITNEATFNTSNQQHLLKMLNDAMMMRAASAHSLFNQPNTQASQTSANGMPNINLSNILPLFMPMHS
jgi:hypothetical protein